MPLRISKTNPVGRDLYRQASFRLIFERILVAVDGSKHSDAAFELATKMAQEYSSQLFVLHVFQGGTRTAMFVVPGVEERLYYSPGVFRTLIQSKYNQRII